MKFMGNVFDLKKCEEKFSLSLLRELKHNDSVNGIDDVLKIINEARASSVREGDGIAGYCKRLQFYAYYCCLFINTFLSDSRGGACSIA